VAVDPVDIVAARIEREEIYSLTAKPSRDASGPSIIDELRAAAAPFTLAQLNAPRVPYPHLFWDGTSGVFPRKVGCVVFSSPRNGKTTMFVHAAKSGALGHALAGFNAVEPFATLMITLEDSKDVTYLDLLKGECETLTQEHAQRVLDRVRVIDMRDQRFPGLSALRVLVDSDRGQPVRNHAAIEGICELVEYLNRQLDVPIRAVFIDTANRANAAGESNEPLRLLVDVADEIGLRLDVAVILSHHTSQAGEANLRTLEISANDARGGTALIGNTRQTWMLVNLGSAEHPIQDRDARTILRNVVNPSDSSRVSALICLDSSKCPTPRPFFLRWAGTRQVPLELPPRLRTLSWWELHREISVAKSEATEDAKQEKSDSDARKAAAIARALHDEGAHPTASAVSGRFGKGKSGATDHLNRAVELGFLVRTREKVPKAGVCDVYRPAEDA
jgi:hypothetical protein